MENAYGTTNRYITLNEYQSMSMNTINDINCHIDKSSEIYAINGMKHEYYPDIKSSRNNMYIKRSITCVNKKLFIRR